MDTLHIERLMNCLRYGYSFIDLEVNRENNKNYILCKSYVDKENNEILQKFYICKKVQKIVN